MIITVERNPRHAPCSYIVCKVFGNPGSYDWNEIDEENIVLVQSDWDFPGLARVFGWIPCSCGETDGTVDCAHRTASEMIHDAIEFLDALCESYDEGRFVEDPGYFG